MGVEQARDKKRAPLSETTHQNTTTLQCKN